MIPMPEDVRRQIYADHRARHPNAPRYTRYQIVQGRFIPGRLILPGEDLMDDTGYQPSVHA